MPALSMYRCTKILVACMAASFLSAAAFAQGLRIDDRNLDGQSVKLGETDLVPSIRIEFESTDNAFRSNDDETDSTRVIVNPEVTWFAERRLLSLKAKYEGSFATGSEDVSDFTDHLIGFTADANFDSRNRSRVAISIAREHDDFGNGVLSNATESDPNDVAESTEIELVGAHTYGAANARGNLTGGLRILSVEYDNQPGFTEGRDSVRFQPFAEFGYRVSADTRAVLGVRFATADFDNDFLDRDDLTIFSGFNFSATGALSGSLRVGATQSVFDASQRDDETSLFLDSRLVYRPSAFARIQLNLRRELDNSRGSLNNLESAINTDITASWEHEWSSRISSRAAIDVELFDGICPDPSDVITTPSFEIEYALRRWFSFGLSASQESRVVSDCDNMLADDVSLEDYDRVDFGAFIRGTL